MRMVTFTVAERLVLVPVEILLIWKLFTVVVLGMFILCGFGPELFSLQAAFNRGLLVAGSAGGVIGATRGRAG